VGDEVEQTTEELPCDVATLRRLLLERERTIEQLTSRVADLEHNVEVYRRMLFAPSSEKRRPKGPVDSSSAQGHLFLVELLEEAERVADETGASGAVELTPASQPATQPSKRKRGQRNPLPEHLHRVRTTYELSEDQRQCACGQAMPPIGVELSQRLERVEFCVVHEIARTKYACKVCEQGVLTAPGPAQPFAKSLLGPGMLAHLIVERFGHHMPYYRLEKKYEAEGVHLSRSVLSESSGRVGSLLAPIWRVLGRQVVTSPVIWADDTPTVVLESS